MILGSILKARLRPPYCITKMYLKHKVASTRTDEYEEAINALNNLQSNTATIQEARKRMLLGETKQIMNVEHTNKYLKRCDVNIELFESKVIHISGTKGKGSTCSLCENILRAHGFKTGFYSSPHLIAVRERIRINGEPLSPSAFTSYFWDVYNKLVNNKEDANDMPSYFKFLTVMALNVFLAENVDVAVVEVGIGGEYDCTNVFKGTPVVGITSLGMDHTNLLGDTVESIAWHKAGIMKPNGKAFSAASQPPSALAVLQQRAADRKCALRVAPALGSYAWGAAGLLPSSLSNFQALNASLAIQLAHAWIRNQGMIPSMSKTAESIKCCKWPGRFHVLKVGDATFYIDGAHTPESIQLCIDWFNSLVQSNGLECALIFNAIGLRDPESLLRPLALTYFNYVFFCPNTVSPDLSLSPPDLKKINLEHKDEVNRCLKHKEIWEKLGGPGESSIVSSVSEALDASAERGITQVLITGSLHLVGSALYLLDPSLC